MSGREREAAYECDFSLAVPPVDWISWYSLTTQGKSVLDKDDRRHLESVEAERLYRMFDQSVAQMRADGVSTASAKIALLEKSEHFRYLIKMEESSPI